MTDPAAEPTSAPPSVVLVVEDDVQVRRFLRAGLEGHGYRLVEAERSADAIRMAAEHVPELVLLDLGLPDRDGVEVIRRLREWTDVPILVVSARTDEEQKIEALDAGADDYLTKPVAMRELLARMRVALRHHARIRSSRADAVFTSGNLRVDLPARQVFLGARQVRLTPIEYRMLLVLVHHAGKVVTQRHLLREVWGPNRLEHTHYLRVHMAHLRRKLEEDPARPRRFLTEAGVGYRLAIE